MPAAAAGFSLAIGPPVAAGAGVKLIKKSSVSFAVRMEECEDLGKAQISGTAEGLVNGSRLSTPIMLAPVGAPGVYLVEDTWSNEGTWVVNLSATCGSAKAGAIVAMGRQTFVRESSKFYPRPATAAEESVQY